MKKNCYKENIKGFTLLEILVVVLIIGILASIAIPSYITALDKTKYAKVMTAVDAVADAEEAYYLQYRKYTPDARELDVRLNYPMGEEHAIPGRGKTIRRVVSSYGFPEGGYIDLSHIDNYDEKTGHWKMEEYVSGHNMRVRTSAGSKPGCSYYRFLNHKGNRPGTRWCVARSDSDRYNKLCRSLGGVRDTDHMYEGATPSNWYLLP